MCIGLIESEFLVTAIHALFLEKPVSTCMYWIFLHHLPLHYVLPVLKVEARLRSCEVILSDMLPTRVVSGYKACFYYGSEVETCMQAHGDSIASGIQPILYLGSAMQP